MSILSYFVTKKADNKREPCRFCDQNIDDGEVMIGLEIDWLENTSRNRYLHLECFKVPKDFGTELKGMDELSKEEAQRVREYLKDEGNRVGAKKWRRYILKPRDNSVMTDDDKVKDRQIVVVGNALYDNYTVKEMKKLLKLNDIKESGGKAELARRLASGYILGVFPRCDVCKNGNFRRTIDGYRCKGCYDARAMHYRPCNHFVKREDMQLNKFKEGRNNIDVTEFLKNHDILGVNMLEVAQGHVPVTDEMLEPQPKKKKSRKKSTSESDTTSDKKKKRGGKKKTRKVKKKDEMEDEETQPKKKKGRKKKTAPKKKARKIKRRYESDDDWEPVPKKRTRKRKAPSQDVGMANPPKRKRRVQH